MRFQRLRPALLVPVLALLSRGVMAEPTCDPTVQYPGASWPDQTAVTAQNQPQEIAMLESYMFTLTGADADRKGIRTDGLIIIQNGFIIYEKYARGFTATNKHLAWSVTKSLMHALLGIALQNGVALTDSVCKYLPQLAAGSCAVQIQDLIELSSGLYWDEEYENESNQASSVLAMLYGQGHRDMASFIASQGQRFPHGSTWYYSTGDATLLGAVLDAALQPKLGSSWQWSQFFTPLGITDTTLERDAQGHSVGGSLWWAMPRDLARLGYLYLNGGCWNGAQFLPAGWTANASMLAATMAAGKSYQRADGEVYGNLWWLNTTAPAVGQTKQPWPDVPGDAFYADGHWNQLIVVIPSKNMVIVRTGDDRDESALDWNNFLKLAIAVGH
jgi:CubicO group peptidase (beta-lactamase class C family)